jgi:hypothetical protein
MNTWEFVQEYGGILNLLRAHAFLMYAPGGEREYGEKLDTAAGEFANLVRAYTGVPVPFKPGMIPIEGAREPTWAGARILAKSVSRRYLAQATRRAGSPAGDSLTRSAELWELAFTKLEKRE